MPDKIKVLLICDCARAMSGPHRNVVGSLNALAARDDIDLRLLSGCIEEKEAYAKAGKADIYLGFYPHDPRHIPWNLASVRRAARGRDLIYVPTGLKSFLYGYLAKGQRLLVAGPNITGIPLLMNTANPSPLMTTRMADCWIEMSEVRVRECVSGGTPRDRIHLVPHALDMERFNPKWADRSVWKREGLDPNRKIILYVGRMNEEIKGIAPLIEAFRLIRSRVPEADLVLVGREGPQLTPELRRTEGLRLLGPRYGPNLSILLASADLFLGASRYETFWFTPLEAMASGIAVVVSNAGATATMIPEDGVQGRRVRILDEATWAYSAHAVQQLADAAVQLLVDDDLRLRIGAAGRDWVAGQFSERRLGEALVQVFRVGLTEQSSRRSTPGPQGARGR